MPPAVQYSHARAATPVIRDKHHQDYPDQKTRALASLLQALQEDQPLKIAHRQQRWHCIRVGHLILLED